MGIKLKGFPSNTMNMQLILQSHCIETLAKCFTHRPIDIYTEN